MAIFFHLFVVGYEEPTLYRRFGTLYDDYRQAALAGSRGDDKADIAEAQGIWPQTVSAPLLSISIWNVERC
jgi:hypothetical protein